MTRINLLDPRELTDQHLIAEYRELPRIFGAVRNKLANEKEIKVGDRYKMGTGHVVFFYDKIEFLEKRYYDIVEECQKRGFKLNFSTLDLSDIPDKYKKDYKPDIQDLYISVSRIQEKLQQKKGFYKMYGKNID